MRKEIVMCDVCKEDYLHQSGEYKEKKKSNIQVIFTTDQTEGRPCSSYLQMVTIDICPTCFGRILDGNYLFATGAKGHNTYKFKEVTSDCQSQA